MQNGSPTETSSERKETGRSVRSVLEQIGDLLIETDTAGRIRYASAKWERNYGFKPEQLHQVERLLHTDDRAAFSELLAHCMANKMTSKREVRLCRADGERLWFELQVIPAAGSETEEIEALYWVYRDTNARHQHEERLIQLAYHDPLTGLPNRRLFREHLNQALALSKRSGQLLGILYFDVNNFKRINDTMGHDTGDQFLQAFAVRVRSTLREVDTFARIGGDEFAALLPNMMSAENMRTITARIERSMSALWHVAGHTFKATASIGTAVYPNDGTEASVLLKLADLKLYEEKHGREELSS
ncbi:diguanylate cyclase domain-containing protein [Paenibacillus chartarius]|uniref:Diguanylate cyclase domain-containing protein n=1 Tax=Paenibacillus chartarius TaxID=747481 RepID=A0ABV6DVC7_9BACL